MNIFVYCSSVPRFDIQAGDRRFAELLRLLARSHRIDLCVRDDEADPSNPQVSSWTEKYRRHMTEGGVRLLPAGWRHVERSLLKQRYDFGFFEFYYNAVDILPLFRRIQPQARVLTDSVDVHYAREEAAVNLGLLPRARAEETRQLELAIYKASDLVIAVSEFDRVILEREVGLPPIMVVPIILPIRPRQVVFRENELVFIGGFQHLPNLDGLRWFVEAVWPLVREAVPDATLSVIGSNVPPEVSAMAEIPGIRVLGYVPDTVPHLDRAAVSVAPLRFGAGMKGKVTEAMACGVPVVTTTVGVQGLNIVSGEHLLVSDGPHDFAGAVISLLLDPAWAREVGMAGQRYVEGVCSPEVVARLAEEALAVAWSQSREMCPVKSLTWDRVRFEALRFLNLPSWGSGILYRRYLKNRLRAVRDRFLQRRYS